LSAGGATDVVRARDCARLQEMWGHLVIVENKPGAKPRSSGWNTALHASRTAYTNQS